MTPVATGAGSGRAPAASSAPVRVRPRSRGQKLNVTPICGPLADRSSTLLLDLKL
jgi:hypothetical protein